ncbi:MAG: modification enzyme MiaB family [Bacillales bacterium]|nr:modification enzyme MiaB family [Bacillales bacterium]
MQTVAFQTLGCKVNHYETEAIWKLFNDEGYTRVDFEEEADVYIINTCTVTNTGDKKSRQVIRRAIRTNPEAVICVTGCYAQTSPADILAIPGVDLVIGTQDRDKLLDYINQYHEERQPLNLVKNIMKTRKFENLAVANFSDRTRATLKIQEGCNNFCTFCIIPWARGLMRSRDPQDVINQAQKLIDSGYHEIVLTGIHTGGYGEDLEDYSLAKLLEDLDDRLQGDVRIRISSIEATQISDEVINLLAKSNKFVKHLHVPLQSGSQTVLKRMKRKYTMEQFADRIKALQTAIPDIAITSDVIVGFPGETEAEFLETYNFIVENRFTELHVFPYSKRTGTPAAIMTEQLPEEIKNIRVHKLIELSNQLAKEYASRFEGQIINVIPEEISKDDVSENCFVGYSDNYLKVIFNSSYDAIGKIIKVKIVKSGYPLNEGEVVNP